MKQFILHTKRKKNYCSGEGLEGNIRTIRASPPKNYNGHLIKEEEAKKKQKTLKYVLNVKTIIANMSYPRLF